jgi:Tyrosine-protein kinase ephrin type A/B receptor-like/FG-GAP-like repeat
VNPYSLCITFQDLFLFSSCVFFLVLVNLNQTDCHSGHQNFVQRPSHINTSIMTFPLKQNRMRHGIMNNHYDIVTSIIILAMVLAAAAAWPQLSVGSIIEFDGCSDADGGELLATTSVAGGNVYKSLVPADVDGDGDEDLVYSISTAFAISWIRNKGDGTFQAPRYVEIDADQYEVRSMVVGDLNSDSRPDIIAFKYKTIIDRKLVWFRQLPRRDLNTNSDSSTAVSFADPVTLVNNPSFVYLTVMHITKLDEPYAVTGALLPDVSVTHSHFPDILIGDTTGGVYWYKSYGDGTIDTTARHLNIPTNIYEVCVADINHDGFMDVIAAGYFGPSSHVTIALNRPAQPGTFTIVSLPNPPSGTKGLAIADLNNDKHWDIIASGITNDDIKWWSGDSSGTSWVDQGTFSTEHVTNPEHITAADIDGDGYAEIFASGQSHSGLEWFYNNNTHLQIQTGTNVEFTNAYQNAYAPILRDMTGDGFIDVTVLWSGAGKIVLYPQVLPTVQYAMYSGSDPVAAMKAWDGDSADFDHDGHMDIVIATHSSNGEIKVMYNAGDSSMESDKLFNSSRTQTLGCGSTCQPRTVVAADLNLDSYADVIVGDFQDDTVVFYLSTDHGTAFDPTPYIICDTSSPLRCDGVYDLAVCDIDRDGLPDIVAASEIASTLQWFRNRGQQYAPSHMFEPGRAIATDIQARSVICADMNSDSWPDVAVVSYFDSVTRYYQNQGNATHFTGDSPSQEWNIHFSATIIVCDCNADGHPDIVVAGYATANVLCFLNNGFDDASMSNQFDHLNPMVTVVDRPFGLTCADVDRDGLQDIITSAYYDNKVVVLVNEADETQFQLVPLTTFSVSKTRRSIAVDLTGNGFVDIVACSDSKVDVFLASPDRTTAPIITRMYVSPSLGNDILCLMHPAADTPCRTLHAAFHSDLVFGRHHGRTSIIELDNSVPHPIHQQLNIAVSAQRNTIIRIPQTGSDKANATLQCNLDLSSTAPQVSSGAQYAPACAYLVATRLNRGMLWLDGHIVISKNHSSQALFRGLTIHIDSTYTARSILSHPGDGPYALNSDSSLTIKDFEVSGIDGAGIYVDGSAIVTLRNVTVQNCHCTGAPCIGGGVSISSSSASHFLNLRLVGNSATSFGGGIGIREAAVSMHIRQLWCERNTITIATGSSSSSTPTSSSHPCGGCIAALDSGVLDVSPTLAVSGASFISNRNLYHSDSQSSSAVTAAGHMLCARLSKVTLDLEDLANSVIASTETFTSSHIDATSLAIISITLAEPFDVVHALFNATCKVANVRHVESQQLLCSDCAPGSTRSNASTAYDSSGCIECPRGSHAQSYGATSCDECSPGTATNTVGSTFCAPCRVGAYAPISSMYECSRCPAGSISFTNGMSTCFNCSLGGAPDAIQELCIDCAPGRYAPSEGTPFCLPCSRGHFANESGSIKCEPCDLGTFARDAGAIRCDRCEPGTVANVTGSTVCHSCEPGRLAPNSGSDICELCPLGRVAATSGSSSCVGCGDLYPGHVANQTGSSICYQCEAGKYSSSDHVQCLDCPRGTIAAAPGLEICSSCPHPSYQVAPDNGMVACVDCKAGHEATDAGTHCVPCPLGQERTIDQSSCTACSSGTVANTTGSAYCYTCEAGRYGLLNGYSCSKCDKGKYTNSPGASSCDSCTSFNTVANTTGATTCWTCEPGSHANSLRTECIDCGAGSELGPTQQSCTRCRVGYFSNLARNLVCNPCSPGTYAPAEGMTQCFECGAGTYVDLEAQRNCTLCPAGQFQQHRGKSKCRSCGTGHASTIGSAQCTSCAQGKYQNVDKASECTSCSPGSAAPGQAMDECKDCAPGRYADGYGTIECRACDVGYMSNIFGASRCLECYIRDGVVANRSGSTECYECEAGTEATGDNEGTIGTDCARCGRGYFRNLTMQACRACAPGTFSARLGSKGCESCPPGSYISAEAAINCNPCARGSFSSSSGAARCTRCATVEPVMLNFANATGLSKCFKCPFGSIANEDSTGCTKCPAGRYRDTDAYTSCRDCPAGRYSGETGSTECHACVGGFFSTSGANACQVCEPGTFSANIGTDIGVVQCTRCTFGQVANQSGMTTCFTCGAGTETNAEALSGNIFSLGSKCVACSVGRYRPSYSTDTEAIHATNVQCKPCPAGTFGNRSGLASCVPCAAGSVAYTSGLSTCFDCGLGTFSNASGQATCSSCPRNTYANAFHNQNCTLCGVGSVTDATGSVRCTTCAAGYFHNIDSGECEICPSGTFTNATGQTLCRACLPGASSRNPGSVACVPCAAGRFSNVSRSSTCTPCPVGFVSTAQGSASCVACKPGSSSKTAGAVECFECPEGRFQNAVSLKCEQCEPGHFSNTTAALECSPCPRGQSAPQHGSVSCSPCARGSYTGSGAAARCDPCPVGTYADQLGSVRCKRCPSGAATAQSGAVECSPCARGEFVNISGQASCDQCPPRTYANETASTECNPCPIGTFATQFASVQCTDCPVGRFASTLGNKACHPCPRGTYSDTDGAIQCQLCPNGTGTTSSGSVRCEPCPTGQYQDVHSRECLSCAPGRFMNETGSTRCHTCSPGMFATLRGSVGCVPCAPGTFSNISAAVTCQSCPLHHYNDKPGQQHCLSCTQQGVYRFADHTGAEFCDECDKDKYLVFRNRSDFSTFDDCHTCPPNADCSSGRPIALPKYWLDFNPATGVANVYVCSNPKACMSQSQRGSDPNNAASAFSGCGANRLPADINPLCASCADNFQESGGDCVRCENTQYGVIALMIVMVFIVVLVFHLISQKSSAFVGITVYFLQMIVLFAGTDTGDGSTYLLESLNIDFLSASETSGSCIMPMSDHQRLLLDFLFPMLAFGAWAVLAVASMILHSLEILPLDVGMCCNAVCFACCSRGTSRHNAVRRRAQQRQVSDDGKRKKQSGTSFHDVTIEMCVGVAATVSAGTDTSDNTALHRSHVTSSMPGSAVVSDASSVEDLADIAHRGELHHHNDLDDQQHHTHPLDTVESDSEAENNSALQGDPEPHCQDEVDEVDTYEGADFHMERWWRSLVALYLLTFNSVLDASFSALHCIGITTYGQTVRVLQAYPTISCDDSEYAPFQVLGIVMGCIYMSIIVAVVVLAVRPHYKWIVNGQHRQLQMDSTNRTLYRWGELVDNFEVTYFFWTLWTLLRRAALVAVIVFLAENRGWQQTIASILNMLFVVVHVRFRPYYYAADNLMELVSLTVLAIFTMLLTQLEPPYSDSEGRGFLVVWLLPLVGLTAYTVVRKAVQWDLMNEARRKWLEKYFIIDVPERQRQAADLRRASAIAVHEPAVSDHTMIVNERLTSELLLQKKRKQQHRSVESDDEHNGYHDNKETTSASRSAIQLDSKSSSPQHGQKFNDATFTAAAESDAVSCRSKAVSTTAAAVPGKRRRRRRKRPDKAQMLNSADTPRRPFEGTGTGTVTADTESDADRGMPLPGPGADAAAAGITSITESS